jgi:NADPH:quinone reductase
MRAIVLSGFGGLDRFAVGGVCRNTGIVRYRMDVPLWQSADRKGANPPSSWRDFGPWAALNIASNAGLHVIATTRNQARFEKLLGLGRREWSLRGRASPSACRKRREWMSCSTSSVIERSSIQSRSTSPRTRLARRLAGRTRANPGVQPVAADGERSSLQPVRQLRIRYSGVSVLEVPLQEIVDRVGKGIYKAKPAAVFSFDEIRDAQRLMESNQATGKIAVKM